MESQQIDIQTEHIIHGGMYSRTIRLKAGEVISGAHYLVPTLVVTDGDCLVSSGDFWVELLGYHVIPASSGRKQIFVARRDTAITMIFRTDAKTIEKAEEEFTDEACRLMSRRSENDIFTITGE